MSRTKRILRAIGRAVVTAMEGPSYTTWMWMGFMPYRQFVPDPHLVLDRHPVPERYPGHPAPRRAASYRQCTPTRQLVDLEV